MYITILILLSFLFMSQPTSAQAPYETPEFKEYWYAGKAEVTSYKLRQARYGETHDGYVVLIFVTEDFSRQKQVKLDNPLQTGRDIVKVLKLNTVRKFDTGIYRYSIMKSVFTPVDITHSPNTLKVSTSSQEWCGNVFTQINLREDKYLVRSFSYFESEGDKNYFLPKEFLEDEIFTRIRIDPESLPTGSIKIIPNTVIQRFTHSKLGVTEAVATLSAPSSTKNLRTYTLQFQRSGRKLTILFENRFPHKIVSWEESYISPFGKNRRRVVTTAKKNKELLIDYWNKNKTTDKWLRQKLGIE